MKVFLPLQNNSGNSSSISDTAVCDIIAQSNEKRKIQLNFCFSEELSKYCKVFNFYKGAEICWNSKRLDNKQTLNTRTKKCYFLVNLYLSWLTVVEKEMQVLMETSDTIWGMKLLFKSVLS